MVPDPVPAAPDPEPRRTLPRRERVHAAFDSSMPVASRRGLAGREVELRKLSETVLLQNAHAIIFGARGSGKTSLARIFGTVADEADALVLYNLASGDVGFCDLFRPYLRELSEESPTPDGRNEARQLLESDFDARALANHLVAYNSGRSVMIVDEFDRISSTDTKVEVAALMKLLSDMRSQVRLVLVGIAGNVDDLIGAHPSLRRHLVVLPIGTIDDASVRDLIAQLASRAGMTVDDDALDALALAAIGSPYHTRLFGLHSALAALDRQQAVIDRECAVTGINEAYRAWRDLGGQVGRAAIEALGDPRLGYAVAMAAIMMVYHLRIVRQELADHLQGKYPDEGEGFGDRLADEALAALRSDLVTREADDVLAFADPLEPQFLLQIYSGTIGSHRIASAKPTDLAAWFTRSRAHGDRKS